MQTLNWDHNVLDIHETLSPTVVTFKSLNSDSYDIVVITNDVEET